MFTIRIKQPNIRDTWTRFKFTNKTKNQNQKNKKRNKEVSKDYMEIPTRFKTICKID